MKSRIKENIVLSGKYVLLKIFEIKDISRKYINGLNNNKVNKYLEVGKAQQNYKKVKKYIQNFLDSKKNFMFLIKNKKNNSMLGTATIRAVSKNSAYVGYMISDARYWGTQYSYLPFKLIISFIFNKLKYKRIICTTLKKNIGVIIFLKKFGFEKTTNSILFKKMGQKKKQSSIYLLNKINYKKHYEKKNLYT